MVRWERDYKIANDVGLYVGIEITKLPMTLADTLMHGQRTTNGVGSCVGNKITKLPMMLGDTLV